MSRKTGERRGIRAWCGADVRFGYRVANDRPEKGPRDGFGTLERVPKILLLVRKTNGFNRENGIICMYVCMCAGFGRRSRFAAV